ncbi:lipopolysaccharide assembly protein LapA domain-containing protein [Parasulfitobacter algicola]|uniref:LapA family protein n=1 Tax=Parasulfitobacter algicola TaxID=2614809 RepID=A0ABX2IUX7_9RHOB|nr:LapA family protein [Sulfitobacter algicola]NSX56703.1 LapA family protein [Sulfitobacter algicola]
MRYIRYLIIASIAICLIVVALANRNAVTLRLLPEDLAALTGYTFSISLPLFVVIFAGIAVGILLGFVWEWMREHKHRSEASQKGREVSKLKREVKRLKGEKHEGKDEVLALLEDHS